MDKYDIFISYRRKGGFETARHLYDLLNHDGYAVSFDIDTLREGFFDIQLLSRIEQCKDFILILDKHAFDRTLNPSFNPDQDWLRKEIAHALSLRKKNNNIIPNIITIKLPGVEFPTNLPPDISLIDKCNGPEYSTGYFDSFYKRLKGFLKSTPDQNHLQNPEGARISFYSSTPCIIKEANKILAEMVSSDEGIEILLQKGRHRLTFISKIHPVVRYRLDYEVTDINSCDIIDIDFTEAEILNAPRLGNEAYDKMNFTEAVKWFRLASEQGNADARCRLGDCYYYGNGVEKDEFEAVKWYRLAAEQGSADACCSLGDCYYFGNGVEKDYFEAVKWFRLAVEQGMPNAQNRLGDCYYFGHGVNKNYSEAIRLYLLAAEQEDGDAQYNLGTCLFYGHGTKQNYIEALKWYRLAADNGNVKAQYKIGFCYEHGVGVKQDYSEAAKWYRLAAEQGDDTAKVSLSIIERKLSE